MEEEMGYSWYVTCDMWLERFKSECWILNSSGYVGLCHHYWIKKVTYSKRQSVDPKFPEPFFLIKTCVHVWYLHVWGKGLSFIHFCIINLTHGHWPIHILKFTFMWIPMIRTLQTWQIQFVLFSILELIKVMKVWLLGFKAKVNLSGYFPLVKGFFPSPTA